MSRLAAACFAVALSSLLTPSAFARKLLNLTGSF
jgi:hypothetical protein